MISLNAPREIILNPTTEYLVRAEDPAAITVTDSLNFQSYRNFLLVRLADVLRSYTIRATSAITHLYLRSYRE